MFVVFSLIIMFLFFISYSIFYKRSDKKILPWIRGWSRIPIREIRKVELQLLTAAKALNNLRRIICEWSRNARDKCDSGCASAGEQCQRDTAADVRERPAATLPHYHHHRRILQYVGTSTSRVLFNRTLNHRCYQKETSDSKVVMQQYIKPDVKAPLPL